MYAWEPFIREENVTPRDTSFITEGIPCELTCYNPMLSSVALIFVCESARLTAWTLTDIYLAMSISYDL